jgi:hypothetical protein
MDIKWVGQEDANGCCIAAVAMVTGSNYVDIRPLFVGHYNWPKIFIGDMDHVLNGLGYTVNRLYESIEAIKIASSWPPQPFADVHLCCVLPLEQSPKPHMVVMQKDGTVLDPLGTGQKTKLGDYFRVFNVAAVSKKRFNMSGLRGVQKGLGLVLVGLMLAVLVAGCGYEAKTDLTEPDGGSTTVPAAVKEVWVGWQKDFSNAPEIAEWMNSLVGRQYKNRTITKIIREKFIRTESGSVNQLFVLVGLNEVG